METITFQAVLFEIAYAIGLDPKVNLQDNMAAALCRYIEKRCREGWRAFDWPDLVRTEQRQYRATWDSSVAYASGDEVYDPTTDLYYSSVQAANLANPVGDIHWWTPALTLDRYVQLKQPGQTLIGEPLGAWRRNPLTVPNACNLQFSRSANGIQFAIDAPSRPWIKFRLPTPKFTTAKFVLGAYYGCGDLVYDADPQDGNCYVCISNGPADESPRFSADQWTAQSIPEFLRDFIVAAVLADTLREDGQLDKATDQEGSAENLLIFEMDQLTVQQRQTRRYTVRTR